MSSNRACPTVPPLYTWDSGTKSNSGTGLGTRAGQASLKALALAVLAVPPERDKAGQEAGQSEKSCPTEFGPVGQESPPVPPLKEEENLSLEKYDSDRQLKPGACRKRLTSPGQAGALDWETLAAWKDEFPHLRPCPQAKNNSGDWLWVNRSRCQGCPWAVTGEARTLRMKKKG